MQQFLLYCTMLIVASEAFPQQLHGSRVSKSIRKRTSRLANKPFPTTRDRLMFRRLSYPLFSPSPVHERPDYEGPFVVPPCRRSGWRLPKRRRGHSSEKYRRFTDRKHSRRKYSRRVSQGTAPLDGFQAFWPPPPAPLRNFTGYFPGVFDSRFPAGNPNQYIVYLYPVFVREKVKRRAGLLKRRRLANSRRQFVSSLRNKNKRSAGNTTKEVSFERRDGGNDGRDDGNFHRTSVETPPLGGRSVSESSANFGSQRMEPIDGFRYNDFQKYQRDYLNLYNPYYGITQPLVTLPTVTFKYPYDRSLYESPLRFPTEAPRKPEEDNRKRQAGSGSHREIGKLREMLQEVESMLESEGGVEKGEAEDKGEDQRKEKEETTEEAAKLNETISLKEKIDRVAIPILSQISERLGKMTNVTSTTRNASLYETAGSNSKAANYRCSPDGNWKSSAYGVEFTFTTLPSMMLKVRVTSGNNSVINKKWSIQGLALSRRGPIMLAAIHPQKRKMASFIGQCKTCQDQDLIFGSWTVFSCARRFADLWGAVETKMDVLRKVKMEPKNSLKKSQKSAKKKKE